jgi:hypothetical protein
MAAKRRYRAQRGIRNVGFKKIAEDSGRVVGTHRLQKAMNKITAIRRKTFPDGRGVHRFVSDSTSSYNCESRRALSAELPNRADSYAAVN